LLVYGSAPILAAHSRRLLEMSRLSAAPPAADAASMAFSSLVRVSGPLSRWAAVAQVSRRRSSPGTSRKSSSFNVQSEAPRLRAHAAIARSTSRPRTFRTSA